MSASTPCAPHRLNQYISDSLSDVEMDVVEQHLATCTQCREQLEGMAASAMPWNEVTLLLAPDELDGPASLSSIHEPDGGTDSARDDEILIREIKGWLDPTDEPDSMGRFAGYEIVGIVGHGGMGIVLKGFERSLNRFVAIKVLAPRLATSATARQRFAREAQAAAAVIHENVIAIHRVDQSHGLPFLVMPYLGGESLQKRIDREGPLDLEACLRVASQVAAGLSAAHSRGLVHRDIKPANIMLQPGVERVTITDFGLARAADDATVTRTGIVAGTPQYMSPEQAQAKPLDARSDLFSLGSLLYTMATGVPPFPGPSTLDVLRQVNEGHVTPAGDCNQSLPVWFDKLIDWLHQRHPDDRPAEAGQVRRLLDACLLHVQQPGKPVPDELQGKQSSKRRIAKSVVAATCLCVASVVYAMIPTGRFSAGPAPTGTTQTSRSEVDANPAVEQTKTPIGESKTETLPDDSSFDLDAELMMIEREIMSLEGEL